MRVAFVLALLVASTGLFAASHPDDAAGCKDHPLVTRMPGYYIYRCEQSPFDAWKFKDSKGKEMTVEGKITSISYNLLAGQPTPSRLQIVRNYENALKPLGGAIFVQYNDGAETYLKVAKDGKETWFYLNLYNTGSWKKDWTRGFNVGGGQPTTLINGERSEIFGQND